MCWFSDEIDTFRINIVNDNFHTFYACLVICNEVFRICEFNSHSQTCFRFRLNMFSYLDKLMNYVNRSNAFCRNSITVLGIAEYLTKIKWCPTVSQDNHQEHSKNSMNAVRYQLLSLENKTVVLRIKLNGTRHQQFRMIRLSKQVRS